MGDTYSFGNLTCLGAFNAGQQDQCSTSQMPPLANSSTPDLPLLQEGLKQYYSRHEEWYHPIEGLNTRPHLLEDYYVELQFGEILRNGFKSEGTLPIEEVFLNRKNKDLRPTRILVTGEGGYGKSTLCKKLAHDWVRKSEYISQFEIVILVRLRGVATSIEDSVVQLCNDVVGSNHEQRQVLQYLKSLGDKFLLILDGYDELNANAKTSLTVILEYGKSGGECFFKLATVLMTTRPENRLGDETNLMTKPLVGKIVRSNLCKSFEIFYNIDELTDQAQISFVEKYFQHKPVEAESLKRIVSGKEMKLTRSPLLLHIMCYIHDQGTTVDEEEHFWEQYLRVIFRRAVSREIGPSSNLSEQEFRKLLFQLGQVFLKHLKEKNLKIEEKEITEIFSENAPFMMSCGLLQRAFSFKADYSTLFEVPHKTLMEYLAKEYIRGSLIQAAEDGV